MIFNFWSSTTNNLWFHHNSLNFRIRKEQKKKLKPNKTFKTKLGNLLCGKLVVVCLFVLMCLFWCKHEGFEGIIFFVELESEDFCSHSFFCGHKQTRCSEFCECVCVSPFDNDVITRILDMAIQFCTIPRMRARVWPGKHWWFDLEVWSCSCCIINCSFGFRSLCGPIISLCNYPPRLLLPMLLSAPGANWSVLFEEWWSSFTTTTSCSSPMILITIIIVMIILAGLECAITLLPANTMHPFSIRPERTMQIIIIIIPGHDCRMIIDIHWPTCFLGVWHSVKQTFHPGLNVRSLLLATCRLLKLALSRWSGWLVRWPLIDAVGWILLWSLARSQRKCWCSCMDNGWPPVANSVIIFGGDGHHDNGYWINPTNSSIHSTSLMEKDKRLTSNNWKLAEAKGWKDTHAHSARTRPSWIIIIHFKAHNFRVWQTNKQKVNMNLVINCSTPGCLPVLKIDKISNRNFYSPLQGKGRYALHGPIRTRREASQNCYRTRIDWFWWLPTLST